MSTNSTKIARKRASSIVPGDRILDGRRPGFTVEAVRPAAFAGVAEVVVTGTTDAGVPARRIWVRGAIVAVRPKVDGDAHCPNGCEGIRPDGSHIHAGDADALLLDFHTFDKSDPWARPKRYDEPKRIVAQPAGRDRFGNPLAARVYLIDRQPELRDDGKARIFAENRTVKAPSGGYYFTPVVVLADSIIKAHPHHPEGFCTLASCDYSRARLEMARVNRAALPGPHPAGCRCVAHELAKTLS